MRQARGHFEQMRDQNGSLFVAGWMFAPDEPIDEFRALVEGTERGRCAPDPRDDVLQSYATMPHARESGFGFHLADLPHTGRIVIEGSRRGTPVARITSAYRKDLDTVVPAPPPELLSRTIAAASPEYYRAEGLRASSEFKSAIHRLRPLDSIGRMLDWGCGAGRNTIHFLLDRRIDEVHGCDIDAEAVAWCRENMDGGTFAVAPPDPPMPYDSGTFDLVIGCSVFTHLGERAQQEWLVELARVLAPGGILAVSVHGDFAADLHFRGLGPLRRRLERLRWTARGFVDLGEDPRLDDAAPPGYYRAVFQSQRYTERRWPGALEIVDYLPAGMQTHQDLVLLRKP